MVAYGHSWVEGAGTSTQETCLAAKTAAGLGLELDNRGVSGSSSTGTTALTRADPPPRAAFYMLMTGLNDLRVGGDSASVHHQYTAALRTIFDAFRRAAPEGLVVAIGQPRLLDFSLHAPNNLGSNALVHTYNQRLVQVAAEYTRVVIAEAADWDAVTMLDPDTVHANDRGHSCLARAAIRATAEWQR